jgi:TRAP-type C4-dicarboxylate transport system permease small subunit
VGAIARMMHAPLNWTADVATCLFAWACFICADIAWRRDGLMSVEIVTQQLPKTPQRVLTLVNLLIIAAFLLFVIVSGAWLSWVSRARTFQGIPDVSYAWVTLSMPVGAALLLMTTLIKISECRAQSQKLRS